MKPVGVLKFPGTHCDRDVWRALQDVGQRPQELWYKESFRPEDYSAFVIPGGFSYGDYLRSGALAAVSPAMESVKKAVGLGRAVLGICNGFQILCEAGLLPGALLKNAQGSFVDQWVSLKLENPSGWGPQDRGSFHRLPIAHGEGRYFAPSSLYEDLKKKGQIWLTYGDNPNGSLGNIAGVMDERGAVVGMMPHPERAVWKWMGGSGGRAFLKTLREGS